MLDDAEGLWEPFYKNTFPVIKVQKQTRPNSSTNNLASILKHKTEHPLYESVELSWLQMLAYNAREAEGGGEKSTPKIKQIFNLAHGYVSASDGNDIIKWLLDKPHK